MIAMMRESYKIIPCTWMSFWGVRVSVVVHRMQLEQCSVKAELPGYVESTFAPIPLCVCNLYKIYFLLVWACVLVYARTCIACVPNNVA